MKKRLRFKLDILGLLLPAVLLAAWCTASYLLRVPGYILPGPGQIALGLADFMTGNSRLSPYSGQFLMHSAASIGRVMEGFLLALCFGLPLGILTGSFLKVKRVFDPLVHLIRMVPGIGWLPIAMVWFGVGHSTAVFLIALAAFFPVYLNTAIGVRQVPGKLIQASRVLGAKGWAVFFYVIIPAAASSILSGMRLGLGISWAYVVLGELTGVSLGLGAVMMNARMLGDTEMIIICMIVIALLGWISDRLLVALIRKLHPGKEVIRHE
ncbi:ABC transporter permease [Desulfosporosinus shakirovi]|uniref:ABC transporter permease n=1 Tax=Desulfosporosinus shakirovi TaxID=2885154 RepID=UPI001E2CD8FC|nr:ABC transporter permease [Desulfosporosinus sp. SRJS8]MCB8817570.1 ABC transporter permease [Desulfosporosinus sp. SRJS8]